MIGWVSKKNRARWELTCMAGADSLKIKFSIEEDGLYAEWEYNGDLGYWFRKLLLCPSDYRSYFCNLTNGSERVRVIFLYLEADKWVIALSANNGKLFPQWTNSMKEDSVSFTVPITTVLSDRSGLRVTLTDSLPDKSIGGDEEEAAGSVVKFWGIAGALRASIPNNLRDGYTTISARADESGYHVFNLINGEAKPVMKVIGIPIDNKWLISVAPCEGIALPNWKIKLSHIDGSPDLFITVPYGTDIIPSRYDGVFLKVC
jgi:hypothetical protein